MDDLPCFCQTSFLGQGLGVDFIFAWDNNNNDKNPYLNFLKGTVLGDKEQGIRVKGSGSRVTGQGSWVKSQGIRDKT